jgi:hypothetical protein
MKKHIILLGSVLSLLFIVSYAHAAPALDATTNLAAGGNVYGTFINQGAATDGKVKGAFAQSNDITENPQYLNIDLGKSQYLDRVKIFWDKSSYGNDFIVRSSADGKYWYDEAANLDAANGVLDPSSGALVTSISLKRAVLSSRYVQIEIPAASKVTSPGNFVRIAEVQAFPSMGQKFSIISASDYAVTENSCVVMYRTSIGAAGGTVNYGLSPNRMDKIAGYSESGIDNSALLTDLSPNTNYFYQIRAADNNGNSAISQVGNFTTRSENLALKKRVSGTFVYLPLDKYVKPGEPDEVLSRVTDGGTSYFTSMASSGTISDYDQYVVIDLEKSYRIKNIVSYWRKLAYPESLTVQVSDNNSDWTTVTDTADAGTGGFARSETGDPVEVLNTAGAPGRYIKLLVKKGSPYFHKHANWGFVQLMEVKAYAE